MNKIKKALTSRTVWTVVVTFILNGVPAISDSVPATWLPAINGVLAILAIYFRVNPKV